MNPFRSMISRTKSNVRLALIQRYMATRTFEPSNAITIFSDPRGGSTWLMEKLCHLPESAPIFEPLHVRRGQIDGALNFGWRQFIPKEAEWDQARDNFEEIFHGRRLNEWVVSRGTLGQYKRSKQLVFKFVRGNSLLPWLLKNFEFKFKPFFLLRHPIAVIHSQIDRFKDNVDTTQRPPHRFAEYRDEHADFLSSLTTAEEVNAATWCLHNLPMLEDPETLLNVTRLHYEQIVTQPEEQLTRAFESLGQGVPESALTEIRKPSQSSSLKNFLSDPTSQIEKWMSNTSKQQQQQIQRILDHFGIKVYSADDPYPKQDEAQAATN